ncbi:hypothetical protein V1478_006333 [Vespula squamosa]|uniref:Uncharacterized protein n=1 Tax=Vespula squamosa TaxID=30214 RepID=A0ABD2B7K9_VESSQ
MEYCTLPFSRVKGRRSLRFSSPSSTRESRHSRNVIRKEALKITSIMFMGLDYQENNVSYHNNMENFNIVAERRESRPSPEQEGERFAGPVGLFDFTCSYVIEYYTRLPRWKG